MPYKSEKQRGYLHIHEPELAKKWDKEYGGKIVPSSKPKTEKPKKKEK
jgi:hypothetical protein